MKEASISESKTKIICDLFQLNLSFFFGWKGFLRLKEKCDHCSPKVCIFLVDYFLGKLKVALTCFVNSGATLHVPSSTWCRVFPTKCTIKIKPRGPFFHPKIHWFLTKTNCTWTTVEEKISNLLSYFINHPFKIWDFRQISLTLLSETEVFKRQLKTGNRPFTSFAK